MTGKVEYEITVNGKKLFNVESVVAEGNKIRITTTREPKYRMHRPGYNCDCDSDSPLGNDCGDRVMGRYPHCEVVATKSVPKKLWYDEGG